MILLSLSLVKSDSIIIITIPNSEGEFEVRK